MLYLLGGVGPFSLGIGIWLAHVGHRYFQHPETTDCVAGCLIVAGLSCLGSALGFCFGPPLH
jgi:hypothetical protein